MSEPRRCEKCKCYFDPEFECIVCRDIKSAFKRIYWINPRQQVIFENENDVHKFYLKNKNASNFFRVIHKDAFDKINSQNKRMIEIIKKYSMGSAVVGFEHESESMAKIGLIEMGIYE